MSEHSAYGPSGSSRYIACPGSVILSEFFANETSEAAAEGSAYHDIAYEAAKYGLDPRDMVGTTRWRDGMGFELDFDIACMMLTGLDYLEDIPGVYLEYRVDLSDIMEDQFGTLDAGYYDEKTNTIVIFDWKFGRVSVPARENTQLYIYGYGFWKNVFPEIKEPNFKIVIAQPRESRDLDEYDCTYRDIERIALQAKKAYDTNKSGALQLKAGPTQCKYCPAKGICPSFKKYIKTTIVKVVTLLDQGVEYHNLSEKEIAFLLDSKAMVEKFYKGLIPFATQKHDSGEEIPGYKLGKGRKGKKLWVNHDLALKKMKEYCRKHDIDIGDIFNTNLKTPTQTLNAFGKDAEKYIKELYSQSEGTPKLVPIGAKSEKVKTTRDLLDTLTDDLIED